MSEPKLWVDISKETRLYPAPNDKLPDFVLLSPQNTLIALHGRPTWESLEYCVVAAQRLSTSISSLAISIRRDSKHDSTKQEAAFLQDVVLAEHDVLMKRLAETVLPLAITALDDIFVPWTRLLTFRENLKWIVQEMAKVGEVLEEFVERGMKKRLSVLRSSKVLQEGVLEKLRVGNRKQIGELEKNLEELVTYCKGGGRFNVAPDGTVRAGTGMGVDGTGEQDPQVALDDMFKPTDKVEFYDDLIELTGLGPRRSSRDLEGGAAVFSFGDGSRIVI